MKQILIFAIFSFILELGCNNISEEKALNTEDTISDTMHYPEPNPPAFERDTVRE
ncbi:hypothetical protein GF406_05615 [candidate division KSB1 bacterium]|nr:hypothetical protein [candidate division KSB1 bacterium]